MIKCVIHTADIHIRNVLRHEEYSEQLLKFISKCKEIASKFDKDEVRIVIAGDLVHQKNNISNELFTFTSTFIRALEEIAKVIVISGNHDLVVNNINREDTMSALFTTANFANTIFLDRELEYVSGLYKDDNIIWALYSIYSDYNNPEFNDDIKKDGNKIIGLYHGTVIGSQVNNGQIMEIGNDGDMFSMCDAVMAGDIHKRQVLKRKNTEIVYPGSLIQQDYGETVNKHGFVVWNMENLKHSFIDVESDYGMYDIKINDIKDFDEDKETLVNL